MSDVRYLFVQKYDYSALLFTFEQLGSRGGAYSIALDDHSEFLKGPAASPLKSSQTVVVFLAFSYYIA